MTARGRFQAGPVLGDLNGLRSTPRLVIEISHSQINSEVSDFDKVLVVRHFVSACRRHEMFIATNCVSIH